MPANDYIECPKCGQLYGLRIFDKSIDFFDNHCIVSLDVSCTFCDFGFDEKQKIPYPE